MSSFFAKQSLLKVWLCIFWQKNIGPYAARKLMVNLTTAVKALEPRKRDCGIPSDMLETDPKYRVKIFILRRDFLSCLCLFFCILY